MARNFALLSLAASASALVAPVPAAKSAVAMNYQASEALPFMEKPEALDGTYAGDVGFDPLASRRSSTREAEIKHGRICMLAWTGFVATDLGFTLPGDMHQVSSVLAHDVACKYGAMQQLFLWLSFTEVILSAGVAQMMWMGSPREPGDYGLDPLDFCSTPEKKADMKLEDHPPRRHVCLLRRRRLTPGLLATPAAGAAGRRARVKDALASTTL
ncbi:chlorophyll A-B binding protein [Aureococcus anophagefferens]|nr:chlorophyll A-B binding protein [Aureococcus anophagefferens]